MQMIINNLNNAATHINLGANDLEMALMQIESQFGEASSTKNGKKYIENLRAIQKFAESIKIEMECLERNFQDAEN